MREGVEHVSRHQVAGGQRPCGRDAVIRFSACLLLAVMLGGSGAALADHAVDHQASSAEPESGFSPLKALQQLTGDSVNEFRVSSHSLIEKCLRLHLQNRAIEFAEVAVSNDSFLIDKNRGRQTHATETTVNTLGRINSRPPVRRIDPEWDT
jgi:hypothetical protein